MNELIDRIIARLTAIRKADVDDVGKFHMLQQAIEEADQAIWKQKLNIDK